MNNNIVDETSKSGHEDNDIDNSIPIFQPDNEKQRAAGVCLKCGLFFFVQLFLSLMQFFYFIGIISTSRSNRLLAASNWLLLYFLHFRNMI